MSITDTELIERIRGGERYRYAQILDRYRDKTFGLAVRMLHNREDAEEATQDAFVRAFRSLETFEGKAKFSTWLYRIVYNVCLTRLERKEEAETLAYEEGMEHGESPDRLFSISHEYETKDMMNFVKQTIDSMPPKYASILTLFYLQEMTHDEICEITQLPLGTVKVHLHRGRLLLRETLAKEFQREGVTE